MNLLIPCSGPGTRSTRYNKFHKALIRIGDKAVLSHIIDSYPNIETIYITLGSEAEYVKQYIEHCNYTNVEFIDIPNWNDSQFASFKQIPEYVFDKPFFYNACDNWTTMDKVVSNNTIFNYKAPYKELYDSWNEGSPDVFYAGISYVKDSKLFYDILQSSTETRNDLNIYHEFDTLDQITLDIWYDVGNKDRYNFATQAHESNYKLLDKTNQEIYYVNNRVIKLFKHNVDILQNTLSSNHCFPHPSPLHRTDNAISYDFVEGTVNVEGYKFDNLLDTLENLWSFCFKNNKAICNKSLWQDKTWQRFEMMCEKHPEFSDPINMNGKHLDPFRILEQIDWTIINTGIEGPCHGDLVLDNIIYNDDNISYIDHREGEVSDIFYDICNFYHSLYLHNVNLYRYKYGVNHSNPSYTDISLPLTALDLDRINKFKQTDLYQTNKSKIELSVGCIWLSMAPLNVNDELNKFLFLFAIEHMAKHVGI